jgi:hypothetical protein
VAVKASSAEERERLMQGDSPTTAPGAFPQLLFGLLLEASSHFQPED